MSNRDSNDNIIVLIALGVGSAIAWFGGKIASLVKHKPIYKKQEKQAEIINEMEKKRFTEREGE